MDTIGTCDPLCVVEMGGQEQRTTVKKSTYAPDWDEPALFYLSDVRFPYYSTHKSATMHVTSASPYKSTQRLARVCAGTGAVPSNKPGFVRVLRRVLAWVLY